MMKLQIFLLCLVLMGSTGCKTNQVKQSAIPETGMIKVAILYPGGEGKTFDMEYYEKSHMPMMAGLLGKNLKFYEIDRGIAGRTATDAVPFVAIGYFYCYDLAEYNRVIGQNIAAIRSDIKKYTNIDPTVQVSEIKQVYYNKLP